MEAVEDFAGVGGECCEDFGAGAAHGHQADGGFGVGLRFGLEDEVGGVGLRVPAGGDVVAVAGGFAVVDAGGDVSSVLSRVDISGRLTLSSSLRAPSWRYCRFNVWYVFGVDGRC